MPRRLISRLPRRGLVGAFALVALAVTLALPVGAASHRDAPLITQDPTADQNDLYAFVSTNDAGTKVLNVVASYIPLEEAADGPNYYRFSDDVRYDLNIENDAITPTALTGRSNLEFQFQFHTTYLCTRTILTYGIGTGCDDGNSPDVAPIMAVGDGHQNLRQTYTVRQVNATTGTTTDLGAGQTLLSPPNNIGRTTPLYNQACTSAQGSGCKQGDTQAQSGAQSTGALDTYTRQSVYTLANGIKVFAGQRADAFYADLAATFDLLNLRNPPVNNLQGYNVHVVALQIPLTLLASPQCPNGACVMGLYTASSRRSVSVRGGARSFGPYVQVGRMANPLFNEIFVALQDKDRWNQSSPVDDQQFAKYALNPEPVRLLDATLPYTAPTTNRTDLAAIFAPDLLRVDTSTAPVPLQMGDVADPGPGNKCGSGSATTSAFSTQSVFGGDTIYSPFQNKCIPSGYPNGRRVPDDATAITIDAGLQTAYLGAAGTGLQATAPVFNHVFPFAATPFNGRNHQHAPQ